MSIRPVNFHSRPAFGFGKTSDFGPFLLLDDFRNDLIIWLASHGLKDPVEWHAAESFGSELNG